MPSLLQVTTDSGLGPALQGDTLSAVSAAIALFSCLGTCFATLVAMTTLLLSVQHKLNSTLVVRAVDDTFSPHQTPPRAQLQVRNLGPGPVSDLTISLVAVGDGGTVADYTISNLRKGEARRFDTGPDLFEHLRSLGLLAITQHGVSVTRARNVDLRLMLHCNIRFGCIGRTQRTHHALLLRSRVGGAGRWTLRLSTRRGRP